LVAASGGAEEYLRPGVSITRAALNSLSVVLKSLSLVLKFLSVVL
jgi:hypothetical protein